MPTNTTADGGHNTVMALRNFFSTEEKSVKTSEMMIFWKSLSTEEKEYYLTADLG